ncbi:Uncharacterised protein [uncultured Butyricicoccus sp.]|uniref:Flagellar protein FlgN n=1 Tax=Agathobaculum ammoniilyticum TaxID=2981778 RepID=A0ABT2U574_9FIRM|nr:MULTISPECIES: hypothetical protein [Butyricicoccaceae]MBS6882537.1 hypothetical protein [Clostridiaceae bacterium]MCU6789768.1 hypothetical protein [Agathobaculum ammoniilyticum]WOC74507.1 hypothetical protein RX717_10920 [Intestinibacillus sp. NTUH-41-i26]SCJ36119.1 Uncharacterised protein [uncultured Butyricicoccus sp.]
MNAQAQQLLTQLRRRYTALSETLDLTVQLGESLDRGDRTSFGLLLTMRQESILRLQASDQAIHTLCASLSDDMQQKWQALLDGGLPEDEEGQLLARQMAQNRQLLDRLLPLNQRLEQGLSTRG